MRARWYEPETAAFLNVGPALSATGEAYSYASANPLSFTDPLGLWSQQNTWNSIVGFVDGASLLPWASTISNWIAPGSVQLCSAEYGTANMVGTVVSLVIPGVAPLKAFSVISSIAISSVKTFWDTNNAFNYAKSIKNLMRVEDRTIKASPAETIKLYRSVGINEYDDIIKTGEFRVAGNSTEGKYFSQIIMMR